MNFFTFKNSSTIEDYQQINPYKNESMNEENKNLKKNQQIIFVICDNSEPISYCTNEIDAKKKIWELAWDKKKIAIINNNDYNYYLSTEDKTSVQLCAIYKNWLVSYEKILDTFTYYQIDLN